MKITSSQIRSIIREELERYMMDGGGYEHRGLGYMEEEEVEEESHSGHYGMFEEDEVEEDDEMGLYEEDEAEEDDELDEQHDNDQKRMNQPGGDEANYLSQRIKTELTEALLRRSRR
jgi:hypothetical protein